MAMLTFGTAGLRGIMGAGIGMMNVYTLDGRFVKTQTNKEEAKQGLAPGIYIIGNEKAVVK